MQIPKGKSLKNRFIRIETTNQEVLDEIKIRGFRNYMLAILKEGVPLDNIAPKGTVRSEVAINRAGIPTDSIGFSYSDDIIVKPTVKDYFEMEKLLYNEKRRSN